MSGSKNPSTEQATDVTAIASDAPESASFWSAIRESLRGSHKDYTVGPIGRSIILLAIPMVLEMCMESIFAVVDIKWVSYLGPDAMATVTVHARSGGRALRSGLPADRCLRFCVLRLRHGPDPIVQWRRRHLDANDPQLVRILAVGTAVGLCPDNCTWLRTPRCLPGHHNRILNSGHCERTVLSPRQVEDESCLKDWSYRKWPLIVMIPARGDDELLVSDFIDETVLVRNPS